VSLRIALVHHELARPPLPGVQRLVRAVADGLRERGHEPVVISSRRGATRRAVEDGVAVLRVARMPEGSLARRGFTGPLTHLPLVLRALDSGGFDLAHAFSAPDAAAALRWRRTSGRPVVFTCAEALDRASVADQRLRLRLLRGAVEGSDAVTAPSDAARAALWKWMAVQAPHLEPSDAAGHEQLYEVLLGARRTPGGLNCST